MRAEIVSIGSELLLGQIVDTNAAAIARQLAAVGLDVFHKCTVGDNLARVAEALGTALRRAEVVITTGGLGPTADDVTREAVALATGCELVFVPELLSDIEAFFRARGLSLPPSNARQASVPRGALVLRNPVGTAPCFIVETGGRTLASLPGVPREMEHLLLTRVIPHLQERYGLRGAIVSRLLRVVGMGESLVGERLADLMTGGTNPTVGTMAHYGQVDVRIAAKAADEDSARALIVPVEAEARRRLGDVVFGTDADSLEGVVGSALVARRWTLALLEAGTGGSVAQRLTAVADGGPRIEALVGELGWSARRVGATDERAGSLAAAVRAWADTDVGAAIVIGAAEGPGPNPVYPAWTGVATSTGTVAGEHRLGGDPRQVRIRAQVLALDRLRRALLGLPL